MKGIIYPHARIIEKDDLLSAQKDMAPIFLNIAYCHSLELLKRRPGNKGFWYFGIANAGLDSLIDLLARELPFNPDIKEYELKRKNELPSKLARLFDERQGLYPGRVETMVDNAYDRILKGLQKAGIKIKG